MLAAVLPVKDKEQESFPSLRCETLARRPLEGRTGHSSNMSSFRPCLALVRFGALGGAVAFRQ